MRKIGSYVIAAILILVMVMPAKEAEAENVKIEGASVLTAKQMGDYVLLNNAEPKLTDVDIYRLADLFLTIGATEGIRGDIAFAQSILETGFFAYGKDVFPEQNNYSGIGAVGGGAEGAYFTHS